MEHTFENWIDSDNVVKFHNGYRTQCTQYRKLFTFEELKVYYKREFDF